MAFFLESERLGPFGPNIARTTLEPRRLGWLVWAVTLLKLRRRWAADRRDLTGMSAHQRRDIGVTQGALHAEIRRSFWGDPAVRRVRPGWPFNRR